jgi:2-dehydropantoate 2-reductase
MRTRVAVVGVGGVGGFVGGLVARADGVEMTYCVRRPFGRLVVTIGDDELVCQGTVATDPADVGQVDVVLVAAKATDTRSLVPWLRRLVGATTLVAVLQNGVEHAARFADVVPRERIVPVVVRYGAELLAPGRVRMTLDDDLVLPDHAVAARVADLFRRGGLTVTVTPEFATVLWRKLVYNAFSNPLTSLLGLRVHELATHPTSVTLAPMLVAECRAVAAAEGIELSPDLDTAMLHDLRQVPVAVTSSMSQDLRRGRELELDALNGAVVRIAERHRIAVPLNAAIVTVLTALSQASRQAAVTSGRRGLERSTTPRNDGPTTGAERA